MIGGGQVLEYEDSGRVIDEVVNEQPADVQNLKRETWRKKRRTMGRGGTGGENSRSGTIMPLESRGWYEDGKSRFIGMNPSDRTALLGAIH